MKQLVYGILPADHDSLRTPPLGIGEKLGESDSKLVSQLEDRINRLEAELAATRAEKILPQSASVSQ